MNAAQTLSQEAAATAPWIGHHTVPTICRGEIPAGRPDPHAIIRSVAAKHDVSVEELRGSRGNKRVIAARQEAMWTLRQLTRADGFAWFSLPHIGRMVGGRDHSTVHHGVRAHERRVAVNEG